MNPMSANAQEPIPKAIEASYIYKKPINNFSWIIADQNNIQKIINDSSLPYLFSKDNFPIYFNYAFKELLNQEYGKKVNWTLIGPNSSITVSLDFEFAPITIDNSTLLVLTLSLKDPDSVLNAKRQNFSKNFKKICKEIIIGINNLLQAEKDNVFEYCSILIKANRNIVWNFMLNFKYLNCLGCVNRIKYSENFSEVGSLVSWNLKNRKEYYTCKIAEIKKNENTKKWKLLIRPLDEDYQPQEVEYSFIEIEDKLTFLFVSYKFTDNIKENAMKKLMDSKKNLLNLIKNKCEKADNFENTTTSTV